jgi:hypothetical protein
MSATLRTFSLLRRALGITAAVAALFAFTAPLTANAQGTHLWTQSKLDEFEKGTGQGVAIESDGRLREGPGLKDVYTTPSTFVWSVAANKAGVAFVGTGSPGAVYRITKTPESKPFALFETKDLSVQVVRVGPDGYVYAATLPSGKVYRLKADAETKQDDSNAAAVVFDLSKASGPAKTDSKDTPNKPDAQAHYIWDMTFDSQGRLYVATGDPGAVYRIDPAHGATPPVQFFKSDEAHLRTLAWDAKGNLIAGSDGSGLVYRISPDGKGYVLFEAPRREITSVAVGADGTIYAADVGDKSRNPLPPLPVQGIGTATITIVQPSSVQAVNASASLPDGTEIYAISEGQAPRKIWAGKEEIVYALASRSDGLLAVTGNRGHVLRIQKDGSYADLAHLDAQQGLSVAEVHATQGFDGVLIGTGNTGRLTLLGAAEKHEYASDVLDTGAMARFGRVEIEPGSSGYEVWTRSGNVAQPVRGWTDWQPLNNGQVASLAGRFLQWKAELRTGGNIGGVSVNYLPVNAAPVVDDVVAVTGARLNPQLQAASQPTTVNIAFPASNTGADATVVATDTSASSPLTANRDKSGITVRWSAHDDNGDELTYSLSVRGDGETVWRLLKDKVTEKAYSFDAAQMPDGGYQIKVVASDSPSHTPADALNGEKTSDRFEVDTTPPSVANLKAVAEAGTCQGDRCPKQFRVTFDAHDGYSPIAHAEYSLDAGPWQYIEPVDKISDSKNESYSLLLPIDAPDGRTGEHLITVRAYDRFDNVGAAKAVIPAQEK